MFDRRVAAFCDRVQKKEENMNLSDMLKPNLVLSDNSMKEIIKNIFFCITILRLFLPS